LIWRAFIIGPISSEQHNQIGIWQEATLIHVREPVLLGKMEIEKSQELKG
jgi:hypothetical protein